MFPKIVKISVGKEPFPVSGVTGKEAYQYQSCGAEGSHIFAVFFIRGRRIDSWFACRVLNFTERSTLRHGKSIFKERGHHAISAKDYKLKTVKIFIHPEISHLFLFIVYFTLAMKTWPQHLSWNKNCTAFSPYIKKLFTFRHRHWRQKSVGESIHNDG